MTKPIDHETTRDAYRAGWEQREAELERLLRHQAEQLEKALREVDRLRWIISAMQHGNEEAREQAEQIDMQGFADFLNEDADRPKDG